MSGERAARGSRHRALLTTVACLTALGGWNARAQWDGRTLVNFKTGMAGQEVEAYAVARDLSVAYDSARAHETRKGPS